MKKRIIIAGLIIIAAVLLWIFVLTKTFLFVSSDTGVFSIYKNGAVVVKDKKGGFAYLDKGHYTIAAVKNSAAVSTRYITTSFLPWQSEKITSSTDDDTLRPQLLLGRNATLITPLGNGYLYKNTQTRGIEYADENGIKDVSSSFGIVSKDISDDGDKYATVINIERDNNAVYVTTTRSIYKLTSLDTIEKSDLSDVLITRSSLNTQAGKITFIAFSSNGTYSAYSLPTSNISGDIQQIFTSKLLINELTSSGNYAVVYDDNTPNVDASTIASYGDQKQLSPQLVNLSTLEVVPLKNMPNTTFTSVSIDPSGTYIAYRTKLSDHLIIANIADGKQVATLPATTLTSQVWRDKSLTYSYGPFLLSYTPGSQGNDTSSVIMTAPDPITDVTFNGQVPVVATNKGFVYIGSKNAVSVDMNQITMSNSLENYTIGFSAIHDKVVIYRLCGNYDECEPGDAYKHTIQQLSKIADTSPSVHDVSAIFFTANYSYVSQ